MVDLQVYDCVPDSLSYQPIGGQLHVTCAVGANEPPRSLAIDYSSNMVVEVDRGIQLCFVFVFISYRYKICAKSAFLGRHWVMRIVLFVFGPESDVFY